MTESDLLSALSDVLRQEQQKPGDVTISDLEKATGRTHGFIADKLAILTSNGVLVEYHGVGFDGRPKRFWRGAQGKIDIALIKRVLAQSSKRRK
jgi:hypothetical protein